MRAAAAAVIARLPVGRLEAPRIGRWALVAGAAVAVLAAGYLLWLRNSSLFAVDRVTVAGVTTSDGDRLRQALSAAAERMTTLHVDRDLLERTAASYPVVERLEVRTDFPHGMRIRVVEHTPVAVLLSGRSRVAAAAEGSVLRGLPLPGPLPVVQLRGALPSKRLEPGRQLRAVRVLGGAPAALRPHLRDVSESGDRGIVVHLREGPDLIIGSMERLADKWVAAARVLADPSSRGARYLDLRVPERPTAGGLPGGVTGAVSETSAQASTPAQGLPKP